MKKGLLAVLSVGSGCVLLLLFGVSILYQCLNDSVLALPWQGPPFPMKVEGTALSVLQLMPYEGPFWEAGVAASVERAAALLVENTGGEYVSQGAVVLQWEGTTLVFELYLLPPGEKALVLEKDRQTLPEKQPDRCYGWSQTEYPESMGQVAVEEAGGVTMAVVNRSGGRIPLVQICYKSYHPESGIFLGGIAYTVEIRNLQPGERRLLTPFRYVCGKSQVVRIETFPE